MPLLVCGRESDTQAPLRKAILLVKDLDVLGVCITVERLLDRRCDGGSSLPLEWVFQSQLEELLFNHGFAEQPERFTDF